MATAFGRDAVFRGKYGIKSAAPRYAGVWDKLQFALIFAEKCIE
jgi:hypothetical protein